MLQFVPVKLERRMSSFGTYLRGQLEKRGWDQSRLALESGLRASTISNLITKTPKEPEIRTLRRIAEALDLDLGEVLEQAGIPMRRSSTSDLRQRRMAAILEVAPWATQLVETLAELPESEQDKAISFVEHLAAQHRNQTT